MNVTYFEISYPQVVNMLRLARVTKRDVFLDLGCARGLAVRVAVRDFGVKRAIGVEKNFHYYEAARRLALGSLTRAELERVDFWLGDLNSEDWSRDDNAYVLDFKKATVVYDSLGQSAGDILFYKRRLRRSARLVKKDLPLVGYKPSALSRESRGCWFFLMRFPLKRVRSETEWCYYVLGERGRTMKDVYSYYRRQLRDHFKRDSNQRELVEASVRDLKKVVASRPFAMP
jgi:hypothetical protein